MNVTPTVTDCHISNQLQRITVKISADTPYSTIFFFFFSEPFFFSCFGVYLRTMTPIIVIKYFNELTALMHIHTQYEQEL